ncbi:hypothetical protein HPB50_017003 [Hyalomma asiaticum]|uniref:Uncharacterized protein n=1 Tax=Hyalomma asiaticum TaxID=266040 RepID=A0ACB7S111_HYAAI|nr:hypothetical protein HPB50_017003 [Hyalomma asiaticum]
MRVYERAPSTTTRLGKDSTMLSSFHSPFPDPHPSPIQQRIEQSPHKLASIVISAMAVGAACLIFLWGLSYKIRQFQTGGNSDELTSATDSFCCHAFLESLHVDREKDPCEDFQEYVCPRKEARGEASTFRWNTWNAHEALAHSADHPKALSGKLLSVLRTQCEDTLSRGPLEFAKEMTPAVLQAADPPRAMKADQLLLFMVFLSLRLGIETPVHITVDDSPHPTLRVGAPVRSLASSLSFFNNTCPQCIDGVLNVVKEHTRMSLRPSDYLAFEASFDDRLDSVVSSCSPSLFSESGATTALDTLSALVFQMERLDVRMVCVDMPGRIFTVFKMLATRVSTPLPLASVLVHAVASIYQDLTNADHSPNAADRSKGRCMFEKSLPNIWINFYAEVVVNASKNQLVREIFVKITDASKEVLGKVLAPGEEKASLSYIDRLSPFLPFSDLPRDLAPPMPVGNFSALFLLVKNYEFSLGSKRRERHFPKWLFTGDDVYITEPWVVVTPWSYALLDVLSSRKRLMNNPILGFPVAKALWHFLLEKESKLITASLENESGLLSCLIGKRASLTQRRDVLEVLLALRTVLAATKTDGWEKPRNVSTKWQHVSESQLFFLRLGASLCDSAHDKATKLLNAVLQHDSIFAAAFKCPDRGFGSKRPRCFDSK